MERRLVGETKKEFNAIISLWFKNIIIAFNDFDPSGRMFRYCGSLNTDEIFVDFRQLKILMGWMAQSFKNIRTHQGLPC